MCGNPRRVSSICQRGILFEETGHCALIQIDKVKRSVGLANSLTELRATFELNDYTRDTFQNLWSNGQRVRKLDRTRFLDAAIDQGETAWAK